MGLLMKSWAVVGGWNRVQTVIMVLSVFALAGAGSLRAEESPPAGEEDPLNPVILHTPLTTAVRGVPVDITATLTVTEGASIAKRAVLVKLSDFGKPVEYPMTGGGDGGVYHSIIPATLIKGVSVFWYSITVEDSEGRVKSTTWMRVTILEPVDPGSGGAQSEIGVGGGSGGGGGEGGAAGGAGAGGGGGAGGIGTTTAVIGGVLLAGGTAVVIENQDDDDGGDPPPEDPEPEPELPPKKNPGGGTNETAPNTPCVTTGGESVTYQNLDYYCSKFIDDIRILVCGTCTNASISAVASWGEMDSITGYTNPNCDTDGPYLVIVPLDPFNQGLSRTDIHTDPRLLKRLREQGGQGGGGLIPVGSETITVYVNGVQVDQVVWPPLSDLDCL